MKRALNPARALPKNSGGFPVSEEVSMPFTSLTVLAGAAALAVAASAAPALAQDGRPHVLILRLADGQVVQVDYEGGTAPIVVAQPAPVLVAMPEVDPVFAAMDRISALMERQQAAMLRQAAQFASMTPAVPANLPRGASFYSFSSSFSSDGHCTRSTEITYGGHGLKPRMVSSTSGDCGAPAAPAFRAVPARSAPKLITASASDPYRAMVRPAVVYSR
jgi:hypothetical protein